MLASNGWFRVTQFEGARSGLRDPVAGCSRQQPGSGCRIAAAGDRQGPATSRHPMIGYLALPFYFRFSGLLPCGSRDRR